MNPALLKKYTFFTFIFTAAALVALFLPDGNKAGGLLAVTYFGGQGLLVGLKFLPDEPRRWQCFLGSLLFATAMIVAASLAYYFYRLDLWMSVALVILLPAGFGLWPVRNVSDRGLDIRLSAEKKSVRKQMLATAAAAVLTVVYLLLIKYGFDLLRSVADDSAMRSPWDVVPRMFFVIFFLTVLGGFVVACSGLAGELALLPLIGLALLATGVGAAVYAVGFGFDPFIHQATEKVILELGAIRPKPFYYVGQYATVVLLARMLKNGVAAIDHYLVPVAFALTVPTAYWSLRRAFDWPVRAAAGAAAALLLLPLAPFVATTPQGFADALALATFFLALPVIAKKTPPRAALVLLAAAVTLIHPLAGIPLLIFVGILLFLSGHERRGGFIRWIILLQLTLAGSLMLPLAFAVNARLSGAGVTLNETLLRAPEYFLEELRGPGIITRQFNAAFDFVYFWRTVREVVLVAAGLIGLFLIGRKLRGVLAYGVSFLIFLVNYLLLKTFVNFPFLIEYERSNYADRIFDLALFLLAPAALYAFGRLILRAERSFPALKLGLAVMVAVLATSSLYLAYPRRDKYESSRGWSTSAADLQAVRLIDKDAGAEPYVVLANQAVSAGAVSELGFKAYFPSRDPASPEPVFFYPIPTGGPLYAVFLDMNTDLGAGAVALRAMDLAGVDTAYYVVTNYWWHAQKIVSSAKRQSDAWWTVDGRDYVFKYTRGAAAGR